MFTSDNYTNFQAKLGITGDNLSATGGYNYNPISRNRQILEWCYRGSWICEQAVNCVADDMTRAGVEFSGIDPDEIDALNDAIDDLQIWDEINRAIKWARLYGGSIVALQISGQNEVTPLREETIKQGQFRGLFVYDRWMLQPTYSDVVTELGPDTGKPRLYEVNTTDRAVPRHTIDYTRCIRFEGVDLPYYQKQGENGWGMSVIEPLYDRLMAFDSTTTGVAQLVYRAYVRTIKAKGFRQALSDGGANATAAIAKMFEFIRKFQSSEGLTLIDAEDDMQFQSYAFAGLPEVMDKFAEQLSGATGIPLVRLLGQSPRGFSSGEEDTRAYYDRISQQQRRQLRRPLKTVFRVLYRSTIGAEPPPTFSWRFAPLWQMSAAEKADIASKVTEAVRATFADGIIGRKTALMELRGIEDATGVFGNISDEDINSAEEDPPSPEMSAGQSEEGE